MHFPNAPHSLRTRNHTHISYSHSIRRQARTTCTRCSCLSTDTLRVGCGPAYPQRTLALVPLSLSLHACPVHSLLLELVDTNIPMAAELEPALSIAEPLPLAAMSYAVICWEVCALEARVRENATPRRISFVSLACFCIDPFVLLLTE